VAKRSGLLRPRLVGRAGPPRLIYVFLIVSASFPYPTGISSSSPTIVFGSAIDSANGRIEFTNEAFWRRLVIF